MGYNARNDEIRDNVTRMRRKYKQRLYRAVAAGGLVGPIAEDAAVDLVFAPSVNEWLGIQSAICCAINKFPAADMCAETK